ncbi:MAG: hypothetical protein JKX84_03595 [Flavobacteriales bacterium]|nr:hypothetical protein [Flavobacteriales bacterium]
MKKLLSTCAIFAISVTFATAQSQQKAGTHEKAVIGTSSKQQIKKEQPKLSNREKIERAVAPSNSKKAKPELKTMDAAKPKTITVE